MKSNRIISFRRFALPTKRCRIAAVILTVLLLNASSWAADAPDARIVFINSYHHGYSWSDGIEQGLRERFDASGNKIEMSVEYLDSRRFPNGTQIEPLAQAMAVKYATYRANLVVVSDNAAFDFAIKYRERLFPGLPIIFCGYNNFRPNILKGIANITGVNEEISIDDAIELALKVHPETHTLAFITSTGDASSTRISEVAEQSVFPKYRERFDVVVLKNASVEEIRQRLAQLPRNTVLFLSGQTSDQGPGRALTPMENGRLITGVSPFPAYTFWDFHLNTGVIGGHILTGPDQGRAAADMALRILGGTPADSIPVIMTTPSSEIFDYKVMERFGIKPGDLPQNAVIINRPHLLWETYRWHIIGSITLVALETLLIAMLVHINRERRKALAAVSEEKRHLEERVLARTTDLARSEAQLRANLDNTPNVAIQWYDESGRVVYWNPASEKLFGWKAEEAIGKTLDALILSPTEAAEFLKILAQIRKSGEPYGPYVAEIHTHDSRVGWTLSTTFAIPMQGDQLGFACMDVDITERKQAEQELKRSNAELEQFSYSISHDMRQPLRMISSYLQLLEKSLAGQLDGDKQEYFKFAIDGAQRLDQMLVALLEYSRVGRKGEPPNWVESRALLDEALLFLQPAIAEAQAEVKIFGDWPRVYVSRDEIMRLIQNLIGNAVKYRVAGRTPEISVTSETNDNDWRLSIADNGVGILPDQAHRLFQVFQRLHTRAAYEGTGIGLALCRKIVEHHGGHIAAESPGEGRGSTFRVFLPIQSEKTEGSAEQAGNCPSEMIAGNGVRNC